MADRMVTFRKGRREMQVGKKNIAMHLPAEVVEDQLVVPLSLVKDLFGVELTSEKTTTPRIAHLRLPDAPAGDSLRLLADPTAEDLRTDDPMLQVGKRMYESDAWPGQAGKLPAWPRRPEGHARAGLEVGSAVWTEPADPVRRGAGHLMDRLHARGQFLWSAPMGCPFAEARAGGVLAETVSPERSRFLS